MPHRESVRERVAFHLEDFAAVASEHGKEGLADRLRGAAHTIRNGSILLLGELCDECAGLHDEDYICERNECAAIKRVEEAWLLEGFQAPSAESHER